ncbi:MAG TPA: hypothetical protein VGM10_31070 [Actinocrinis sp.]
MRTELNRRADTAARTAPSADDTAPTMSLGELAGLLDRAAEAAVKVERARRPLVLHGPAAPADPAAHPGIDVTLPAGPPPQSAAAAPGHRCGRFTEAQALMLSGLAGSAVGLLDTALTSNRLTLLVALAAAALTVLAALAVAVEIRTHRTA